MNDSFPFYDDGAVIHGTFANEPDARPITMADVARTVAELRPQSPLKLDFGTPDYGYDFSHIARSLAADYQKLIDSMVLYSLPTLTVDVPTESKKETTMTQRVQIGDLCRCKTCGKEFLALIGNECCTHSIDYGNRAAEVSRPIEPAQDRYKRFDAIVRAEVAKEKTFSVVTDCSNPGGLVEEFVMWIKAPMVREQSFQFDDSGGKTGTHMAMWVREKMGVVRNMVISAAGKKALADT